MKEWELHCLDADGLLRRKGANSEEWETLKASQFSCLTQIYSEFVSILPNRDGGMTYGNPTEYDPDTESVISADRKGDVVDIVTRSQSTYRRGEVVRYRLALIEGRWKIKAKYLQSKSDKWKKVPL